MSKKVCLIFGITLEIFTIFSRVEVTGRSSFFRSICCRNKKLPGHFLISFIFFTVKRLFVNILQLIFHGQRSDFIDEPLIISFSWKKITFILSQTNWVLHHFQICFDDNYKVIEIFCGKQSLILLSGVMWMTFKNGMSDE